MKLYDNQVHQKTGSMVIDDYHYVKYAKLSLIRVYKQNFVHILRFCPYARNKYQRKPVFWHILHSVKHSFSRI